MRINNYIAQQNELINNSLSTIERLETELRELKQQLRIQHQLQKAQESAQSELNKWLEQGKKLFKDCASVFPETFLDDMVAEVGDIASEVKEQYDNYSQSDRFLNSDTQEEQDTNLDAPIPPMPTDTQILIPLPQPDNDDDTILGTYRLRALLKDLDTDLVREIKQVFGLTKLRTIETLADALSEKHITKNKWRLLIENLSSRNNFLSQLVA